MNGETPIMNSVTVRDSLLLEHYHHNADEMKMKRMGGAARRCQNCIQNSSQKI